MCASTTLDKTPEEHGRFVADFILLRAAQLADLAATTLLANQPSLARRYGPQPHAKWKIQFEGRIFDLAASVAMLSPEIFALQVNWTRIAFLARAVPLSDLLHSLDALAIILHSELPSEDRELIDEFFVAARERVVCQDPPPPSSFSVQTRHGRLAAEYLVALLEGDRAKATRLVLDAVAKTANPLSIQDAYLEVLVASQRELGRMWHVGEITVAEEHFATATTRRVMAQLVSAARPQMPLQSARAILVASVEGNTHDLGPGVVADFFELAGWRVIELGANVPIEDFALAAQDFNVDVVAISASMPSQLTTVEDTIKVIRSALGHDRPKIIVGGYAFASLPHLWKLSGADGYCQSALDVVPLADSLLATAIPPHTLT